MANEEIKSMNQRQRAINSIAKSVADIEESLSDILNAEGKKIKALLPTPEPVSEETETTGGGSRPEHEPCDNLCCYLAINASVKDMVKSITMLEIVLTNKLELISNCLCPDDPDDVCKKDHQ